MECHVMAAEKQNIMIFSLKIRAFIALQLYRFAYTLAMVPAVLCLPLLRRYSRRLREGISDYLGFVSPIAERPSFWVHGVSMGESMVSAGFAVELKKRFPGHQIVFTTTHPEVLAMVKKRHIADAVAYFPLDNFLTMANAFRRWKPEAVFVAETDFWPEFSWQCYSRKIPLVLINGRLSSKLASFYASFKGLSEIIFSSYTLLLVQSEIDCCRLKSIGVDQSHIKVLGNMKADLTVTKAAGDMTDFVNWLAGRRCVVFGSLHPQEFDMLKMLFVSLVERGIAVIVAPRNLADTKRWHAELKQMLVKVAFRSDMSAQSSFSLMILDSMGELASIYGLASAAFVGGTLDSRVGGHNPLEVMQRKAPLLVGPYCRNFADIISQLCACDGVIVCNSAKETEIAIDRLLTDPELARRQVESAEAVLENSRGVLEKTMLEVEGLL